ncbi:MAG: hypothetical protein KC493_12245 [Bacteriovoracaceae bacterium]|nr:hypothetical protein [Bacteriovoracaceae bacterium]
MTIQLLNTTLKELISIEERIKAFEAMALEQEVNLPNIELIIRNYILSDKEQVN